MSTTFRRMIGQVGIAALTAALTVALLGGDPVGAFSVPNNSVNSAKIANGSVQGIDIKNGTITRTDLAPKLRPNFARVTYNAGVPSITAQSGGLSIVNEPFTGAVRIAFPRNMDNCAVVANTYSGGTDAAVRRSTTGAGAEVVVVMFDVDGTSVEVAFDIVGIC